MEESTNYTSSPAKTLKINDEIAPKQDYIGFV
jgi:hypothetical protein